MNVHKKKYVQSPYLTVADWYEQLSEVHRLSGQARPLRLGKIGAEHMRSLSKWLCRQGMCIWPLYTTVHLHPNKKAFLEGNHSFACQFAWYANGWTFAKEDPQLLKMLEKTYVACDSKKYYVCTIILADQIIFSILSQCERLLLKQPHPETHGIIPTITIITAASCSGCVFIPEKQWWWVVGLQCWTPE